VTTRSRLQSAALALILLGFTGCIGIQVRHGVHDADAYFDRAEREIARLERHREDRPCRVHSLHLLAHDRREGELVRISVPLWMAELAMDIGADADRHHDFDLEERYDVDWRALRDLDRFGPGLLVALASDHDRVLIWLE